MLKKFFSIYIFQTVAAKAVIIYSLCCIYTAKAQQYGFLNYTTDNGLAQSQVTGMCQDKYGYLWFSTYGGVSRFDGLEYKNYSTANGLLNNQVHSIYCDSQGRIWFGCLGGYSVYDSNEFNSRTFNSNGLAQSNLLAITEYPANTLWLLFENSVLVKVNEDKFKVHVLEDTNVTETRSLIVTENNELLIASDNGVFSFNTQTEKFKRIDGFNDINCSFITGNKNQYTVSTFGDGLFLFKNGHLYQHLSLEKGLVGDAIRHAYYDREGNLWASSISGVSLIDPQLNITNFNTANGLINNNVRFTAQDNEGNIWFGTDGKGIMKFTGKSVLNYTKSDGLSGDLVMSVLQDKRGVYWFAHYGDGVTRFDYNSFETFNDLDGLPNTIVWTLAQTPDERIWMGTSRGLSVYDGKKINSFYEEDGLLSNKVTSLFVDKNGVLWIGTKNGLNKYYNGKLDSVSGLSGNNLNIRCIIPDKEGNLWLAGSAGLYRYDTRAKKVKLYKYNKNEEDNTIKSLRFDSQGNLWVGAVEGLFLFKDEKFRLIDFHNDAIAGDINFIMDDQKSLWFGTNGGIFELNLEQYYSNDTLIVKSFGRNEGLKGRETNMNAVYKDRFNNLWFGTDGGLVKVGKQRFSINSQSKPFVHINDVKIFFEKPDWKRLGSDSLNDFGFPSFVKVRHSQNHFTFYFTGISHTQPQKLRYRFMLEGFDQTWLPITETRYVTYSSLPPGSYKFKVMAQNANGLWSEKPAEFSFYIVAPFWKTWWFYSLCVFAIFLVVLGLWQLRLRQLKRKNQTMQLFYKSKLLSLEQQSLNASMNRHFIFNSLNSIQYYINKQDKLEANRYLTNFAKLIRKNLDSSINGDLIPLSEEIERIRLYLSLENMRFKDRFDYEISISPELNPETIMIPPMLFQPYIENSIWHGILPKEDFKGMINIDISTSATDNQLVEIQIRDNGIGISNSLKNKVDTGSTHISRGIEITSGRLSLLKKMTNQNLEIIGPQDITDPSGKTTGTLVKLIISVKFPLKEENLVRKVHEN